LFDCGLRFYFFSLFLNDGGDGCMTCDLRLGTGTTLVDRMRPATRLAMPMFEAPFKRSTNGTSFDIEQMRDLVWSCLCAGAGAAVSAI